MSVSNVGWLFLANFGFGLVWAALGYWRDKPWAEVVGSAAEDAATKKGNPCGLPFA